MLLQWITLLTMGFLEATFVALCIMKKSCKSQRFWIKTSPKRDMLLIEFACKGHF